MLAIGEFSKICRVSTKTLRYYAEIGLILPSEINPENGYRYYAIGQLETMLLINRLKAYGFSLEEIKTLLAAEETQTDKLYAALLEKERQLTAQRQALEKNAAQLKQDLQNLRAGRSIMAYLAEIGVQLVEVPAMHLLSLRQMVPKSALTDQYAQCFGRLFQRLQTQNLTLQAPPMALFHSEEFTPLGLDIEFACPVQAYSAGTRVFKAGLCLKTVVQGSYTLLPAVYAKQTEWAAKEGYEAADALFEVYRTDPAQVTDERELITEVYLPVRKK